MKKRLVLGIIAIIIFTTYSCATGGKTAGDIVSVNKAITDAAEELGANVTERTEIVIAAIKAPDSRTANYLADELTASLLRGGKFTVLERGDALKAVDAEQEFQLSGLVSDESAVGIGHYLGAKVVVTGTFEPYADFSQLRLRAVDVRTAQLLAMPSSLIHPKDRMLANIMGNIGRPQRVTVNALTYFNRGKDLYREKDYEGAIASYSMAIDLDNKNAEFFVQRGYTFETIANKSSDVDIKTANYRQALADYNQAINLNPNLANAYFNRAFVYWFETKDLNLAINDFTQAIRINPNFGNAYFWRSRIYQSQNNTDLVIADLTHVIRLGLIGHTDNNDFFGQAYWFRGDLYENNKNYDMAIADYNQLINGVAGQDHIVNGFIGRGSAYFGKKDYDRAIADFNEAIRLNPNNFYIRIAYSKRAEIYLERRDYDRAIADYEAVLRIDPDNYLATSGLERARQARGN